MIEKDVELARGMVVRQDEQGGLRYQILGWILDATGYEASHQVGGEKIAYEQLEAGDFPVGQLWRRSEDDFRQNFSVVEEP